MEKKNAIIIFVMLLMPLMAYSDAVEIDGIYYNLIKKASMAEVAEAPKRYTGDIVIPDSVIYDGQTYHVTSIGSMAFAHCTQLKSVKIANSVTAINQEAFAECRNIKEIPLPDSLKTIGSMAFYHCAEMESVSIPATVEKVGSYIFTNCTGLKAVYIKDLKSWCRLSWTGGNPLACAHTLYVNGEEVKDLVIPEGIPTIGEAAFGGCDMVSVTIPNSVTSIESYAFARCKNLTAVTLPNSIDSICSNTFARCSALKSIEIPANIRSIGYFAFNECTALTDITFHEGLTSIGINAFGYCSSLTKIDLPSTITYVGEGCFSDCTSLQSMPDFGSVTEIRSYCFNNCTSLASIAISDKVTTIGMQVFWGCTGLTSITIPDNVETIEASAFYDCKNVTTISIGKGIKEIGFSAFSNIPELTDVYCYAEKVPQTHLDAFAGSYIEYATLHVPESATDAYKAVAPWNQFKNFFDPTSIPSLLQESNSASPIYDLSGRRCLNVKGKGIFIQNGKKFVTR